MATFIEACAELARLDLRCMTASRFVPDAKGTRTQPRTHLTTQNTTERTGGHGRRYFDDHHPICWVPLPS
jgi:hypothetical protein